MGEHLTHRVLEAGRYYKYQDTTVNISPFQQHDSRQSKSNNSKAFTRYLALLRGLHQDRHTRSYVCFDWDGPACMVCTRTGKDMHNMFHKKGGTLFEMDETPQPRINVHDLLDGMWLEMECDYNLQECMMCGPCHANYISDKKIIANANRIIHRFWKQHIYPDVRSILRE